MSKNNKYARPTTVIGKAKDSLREDGVKKTLQRGLRLIQRRDPTGIVGPLIRPIHNLRTGYFVNSGLSVQYSLPRMIENQYIEGDFCRCDVLIAAAALDGDDQTRALYREVSSKIWTLPTFEEIEDEQETGRRDDSVPVTYTGEVVDILECAIQVANDGQYLNATITDKEAPAPVTRETLRDTLSENTYKAVERHITEQLRDSGYLFQIVIWPSALEFEDEITEIVESKGIIRDKIDLHLEDELKSFMGEIYDTQESVVWDGIWKKHDIVSQYGSTVRVLFIELPDAQVREGTSHQMRYIKETARTELHTELDHGEISYTCILHSTDNFRHNLDTWNVIEKYDTQ